MGKKVFVDFSVCRKPTAILVEGGEVELMYQPTSSKKPVTLKGAKIIIPPDDDMFLAQLALAEGLSSGDSVYLEMGSGADAFTVACLRSGAEVYRIPPRRIKQHCDGMPELTEYSVAESLLYFADKRTRRFYLIDERSLEMARIASILNYFYYLQKRVRIPFEQKSLAVERASRFLYPKGSDEIEQDALMAKTALSNVNKWENMWWKRLDEATKSSDFVSKYLLTIHGVGPRISGRIIGCASDVRRFPTVADFRSYLGYDVHLTSEGLPYAPRRMKGQELGYHPSGQQGVWNFPDYIVKSPDSAPGKILRSRKEWLKAKYPDRAPWQIHKAACRYMGSKLISYIYFAWRHYLGLHQMEGEWRGWDLLEYADDRDALFERWSANSAIE